MELALASGQDLVGLVAFSGMVFAVLIFGSALLVGLPCSSESKADVVPRSEYPFYACFVGASIAAISLLLWFLPHGIWTNFKDIGEQIENRYNIVLDAEQEKMIGLAATCINGEESGLNIGSFGNKKWIYPYDHPADLGTVWSRGDDTDKVAMNCYFMLDKTDSDDIVKFSLYVKKGTGDDEKFTLVEPDLGIHDIIGSETPTDESVDIASHDLWYSLF